MKNPVRVKTQMGETSENLTCEGSGESEDNEELQQGLRQAPEPAPLEACIKPYI